MLLITHIIIALASIIFTTYVYFAPSQAKLHVSYAMATATLATGTVLVIQHPSHIVPACVSGIIYLGVVAYGIMLTRKKLLKSTYAS